MSQFKVGDKVMRSGAGDWGYGRNQMPAGTIGTIRDISDSGWYRVTWDNGKNSYHASDLVLAYKGEKVMKKSKSGTKKKTQITEEEFTQMKALLDNGLSGTLVAKVCQRSVTTVSYVKRSATLKAYRAILLEVASRNRQPKEAPMLMAEDPLDKLITDLQKLNRMLEAVDDRLRWVEGNAVISEKSRFSWRSK